MTDPETETGAAVDCLVTAVRSDIGRFCGLLDSAAELATAIASEAPGVNGLATWCNGAVDRLRTIVADAQKEASAVERKFTGRAPREPIHARVDEEHAAKVLAARAAETDAVATTP